MYVYAYFGIQNRTSCELFHNLESPTKPIDQHDAISISLKPSQVEGRFPGSWEELYSRVLLLGSKKAPGMYKTL